MFSTWPSRTGVQRREEWRGFLRRTLTFIPSQVRALEGLEQRCDPTLRARGRPLVAAASTSCGGRGLTRTRGPGADSSDGSGARRSG